MYNAQKAEDVGESEYFCVMQEIGVETLPYPKVVRSAKGTKYIGEWTY